MSRASDLEAARLAKERVDARCAEILDVCELVHDNMPRERTERELLERLAAQMLAEATYISERRKAGDVTRSKEHVAAGRILEQWAKDLAAYLERDKPPTRPPLDAIAPADRHADLDPADGPISAQITSKLMTSAIARTDDGPIMFVTPDVARVIREAKTVDDKLDVAFGPIDAAVKVCGEPPFLAGLQAAIDADEAENVSATAVEPIGAIAWLGNGESVTFETTSEIGPDSGETVMPMVVPQFSEPGPTSRSAVQAGVARYVDANWPDDVPLPGTKVHIVTNLEQIPGFSEPGPAPVRQTQKRMTFGQMREHGMARARGIDHRSYSQARAFAECGIRYALSDLETPAWWNVGGTALHYACEAINRAAQRRVPNASPEQLGDFETLWTNCLNRATSEAIAESSVSPDQWRAANKGKEGFDWWRVNGVDMVRRWVTRLTWLYDQGWRIAEFNGVPAIEYDCPMWIYEGNATIKVENIIDLAMTRDDGALLIVDAKSGASAPDSMAQLGQYAHALNERYETATDLRPIPAIYGAYWLARTDTLDIGTTDLRELHPWDEIEYLITTMDAAERAGLYLPNKSKADRFGCGSCSVAGLCPVGPR